MVAGKKLLALSVKSSIVIRIAGHQSVTTVFRILVALVLSHLFYLSTSEPESHRNLYV